jgi:hypothetical protein
VLASCYEVRADSVPVWHESGSYIDDRRERWRFFMNRACNEHIKEALDAARRLTILADEGEADSQDDGCIVLYGVIRDCAYKIRIEAEREKESHKARGVW